MIHGDTAVEHTAECVCSQENSASLPRCHIQLSLQPDPKSHLHSVFCMSKDKGCILFTRGVKQNREKKKEGMVGVGGACRLDALSAIKVIIRQNEETVAVQREKFSQRYIKAADLEEALGEICDRVSNLKALPGSRGDKAKKRKRRLMA